MTTLFIKTIHNYEKDSYFDPVCHDDDGRKKMYAQSNLVVPLEHEGTMTVLCGADAFLEVP